MYLEIQISNHIFLKIYEKLTESEKILTVRRCYLLNIFSFRLAISAWSE